MLDNIKLAEEDPGQTILVDYCTLHINRAIRSRVRKFKQSGCCDLNVI